MKRKKPLLITAFLLALQVTAPGQKTQKAAVITADSLASGNYKDVLTSFFQIAFDKLTGKEKEFKFSSNPYAVMMKANPDLEIDYNYKKNRVLRNLNFSFSIKLDTSYRFNGFSSGISYAIINKRDYAVYDEFVHLTQFKNKEYHSFTKGISAALTGIRDTALRRKTRDQLIGLVQDEKAIFSKMDTGAQALARKIIRDSSLHSIEKLLSKDDKISFKKAIDKGYNEVKSSFQAKPLLTFSISDTTYKDDFMFSNISTKLEFLKGFGNSKPGANWELNIPATMNFTNDTLRAGRDLKRAVFRTDPGINLVIRNSSAEHSFFEMKFSGEYQHIFSGRYPGEEKDQFTFNGTLRIRIIHDIWVPLLFKYDPDKGNVFGFLSVKLNFSGQGKK